jgi:hypothetical protein
MKDEFMMAASELLLRRVSAARNAVALSLGEDGMPKNYSRVEIDGSGKLSASDLPFATIAVVGSIVALTGFLLVFLLVSL